MSYLLQLQGLRLQLHTRPLFERFCWRSRLRATSLYAGQFRMQNDRSMKTSNARYLLLPDRTIRRRHLRGLKRF